jgi:GNAT superfamily N-acetyltransferase
MTKKRRQVMGVTVRTVAPPDERRWRELFEGYCLFYKRDPSDALTSYTWARIMDTAVPVHAIVAEHEADGVIGIANYLIHEHTLGLTPACYLADLFVDPTHRAAGVGKQLIEPRPALSLPTAVIGICALGHKGS